MVGLAGPSGSGKTAFCQKVKQFMPGVAVLHMDMYNDATVPNLDGNFDDPRLTDYGKNANGCIRRRSRVAAEFAFSVG